MFRTISERDHKISNPLCVNARVLVLVAVLGLLLHGLQAGRLGLYWYESTDFLSRMQNVNGDTTKFVRGSGFFLLTERPLADLPFMVYRMGFGVSLSLAHWISVILFVLCAIVLAIFARQIVDQAWFSFAVGVLFLTFPLSPLQTIWLSVGFYTWSAILALLAMLLFLRGLKTNETRRLRWFVFAVIAYLTSILTHEEFILIPPAFVTAYLLSIGMRQGSNGNFAGSLTTRRLTAYGLFLIVIPMGAYGLWRSLALPSYGFHLYSIANVAQIIQNLPQKFLVGMKTAFLPVDDALRQIISVYPPAPTHIVLSGILSLVVWVIILRLSLPETHQEASREDPWLHAVICAAALVIGGILFLAVAPVYIGGVVGTGFASRVNFVMTLGMAFVIPAVLGLAVSSGRFAPWAALSGVFFLIYVGFTSSFLDIQKLFHPSTFSVVLNEYSLKHGLVVFGYIIAVIFLTVMAILSVMIRRRQSKHLLTSDRLGVWWSRIRRQFVPATIACLVFFGSLFHFSVKEEYIAKWDQHKSMLEQLRSLAPALKNDTFVMIIRNQDDPVSPFHHEVTSYLFALYNNKSIMGNVDWQLSFHSDGINPADAKLPTSNRLRPRSRISYDRLLMLEFDGDKLKLPSKVEVKTEEGERLVVFNNPDRILTGPSIKTVVWRYLD